MKVCSVCKTTERYKSGDCKRCAIARSKRYYAGHREQAKANHAKWSTKNPKRKKEIDAKAYLKWKYGLSPDDWDALLIAQAGLCWLCDRPMFEIPCVDHDHTTDAIRGLAHSNCNAVFGLVGEDPVVLLALYQKALSLRSKG